MTTKNEKDIEKAIDDAIYLTESFIWNPELKDYLRKLAALLSRD